MEPGIYSGIGEDAYHSGAQVSISTLKEFAKPGGPARVKGAPPKDTKSLRFGSLIHDTILLPDQVSRLYHVVDLKQLNPDHKAYKIEEERALGRTIVKRTDYDEARRIRDAVMKHTTAAEILSGELQTEQSIYWVDEETGLPCRGRTDIMRSDIRVLADLKSCINASQIDFGKTIVDYAYDWQHSFYEDGVSAVPNGFIPDAFIFIAVEKEEPYLTATWEIPKYDIDEARLEVRAALDRFAECIRTDEWPGYSQNLEQLPLPSRRPPWRQIWREEWRNAA